MGDANDLGAAASNILVVDDDDDLRHLLSLQIRSAGHHAITASDGQQALEVLGSMRIDMVVSDIMMPKMDGFELLRQLRKNHPAAQMPVLMLSARGAGHDVIEAMRLGASDYAIKGDDPKVLIGRIHHHLKSRNATGKVLGNYKLTKRLGAGGGGAVFAATQISTNKRCAIKVLYRDRARDHESLTRFEREAKILTGIEHPHLVRCYGLERSEEAIFMVMELVDGRDLERTRIPRNDVPELLLGLGKAIKSLHQAGVIHRDVKPANVLLTDDLQPKLADLGIADLQDENLDLTRPGIGLGTLFYAAPEQLLGAVSPQSDIYAFGATAYFAWSGEVPFDVGLSTKEVLKLKERRPPKIRKVAPLVSRSHERWLRRLMAPKPQQRPATMQAALDELKALA